MPAMKRRKRPTVLSLILGALGAVALFFTFASGSIVFAVATILFVVASLRSRSTESFGEYRDRYEEKYGLSDQSDDQADSGDPRAN